jgi:hypothetical protein
MRCISYSGVDVQIIVLLKQEAADVFARAPQRETAVGAMVRGLGYSMAPLHPGAKSDTLRRQFVIRVPDSADVEALLSKLRTHPEVDGSYVKPLEEPPEGPTPAP